MDGRRPASVVLGVLAGYALSRGIIERREAAGGLTDRQREILAAVAAGRTTKEIALELGITPASVNTHIRRARVTLGVPTRAAAAVLVWGQAVTAPARPRASALSSRARTTSVTRSSNGTPRSSAPRSIISRLTARANALSFIFLRTDAASTSRTALDGFTSATAVTKPQSSSTA
ncbi:MAG: helix-turn-helix transcriptional regulator [Chloroflexi bacterium]|nr:MAG: helix-turn-helix transcriptional regulator [Chloroflexota bacterium]